MMMKDGFGQGGNMYDYIQLNAELLQNPRFLNLDGSYKDRPGQAREDARPVFTSSPNLSNGRIQTLAAELHRLF
jgi:hypothetical protein